MRRRGQRDESGDPDRPAAARSVDDREEAEGEQGEVEPEQEREEAAVDRVERAPGREREHAEQERGSEAEQHEPAAAGASVQLPRPGHEHREEAGDQPLGRLTAHGVRLPALPPRRESESSQRHAAQEREQDEQAWLVGFARAG